MRFDSARAAGLNEDIVARIEDGYEQTLSAADAAALKLTDHLIGLPQPLAAGDLEALRAHFDDAEIAELALGVGLFHGMSKVLVALGLEPESMATTVLPTPGSQVRPAAE